MQGPYEEDTESKGVNFIPSWIWTVHAPPTPPDSTPPSNNLQTSGTTTVNPVPPATPDPDDEVRDEEVEEYVRVDWTKAQERTKRFEEEIALTVEDMRRTLAFFAWKAKEWERLAELRANATNKPTDEVLQGLQAYAYQQLSMYHALIKSFVSTWHDCLHPKGLGGSWLSGYNDIIVPQKRWNKIPSIIPAVETGPEIDPGDTSDQDDSELEGSPTEQCSEDVAIQLHDDFVKILAYG